MKFRKKPVVVEAVMWLGHGDHPAVERPWSKKSDYRCPHCGIAWGGHGVIKTLEDTQDGGHFVCPGDWIITGVKGEHYACKDDILRATYEIADTPAPEADANEADTFVDAVSAMRFPKGWEHVAEEAKRIRKARLLPQRSDSK